MHVPRVQVGNLNFAPFARLCAGEFGGAPLDPGHTLVVVNPTWTRSADIGQVGGCCVIHSCVARIVAWYKPVCMGGGSGPEASQQKAVAPASLHAKMLLRVPLRLPHFAAVGPQAEGGCCSAHRRPRRLAAAVSPLGPSNRQGRHRPAVLLVAARLAGALRWGVSFFPQKGRVGTTHREACSSKGCCCVHPPSSLLMTSSHALLMLTAVHEPSRPALPRFAPAAVPYHRTPGRLASSPGRAASARLPRPPLTGAADRGAECGAGGGAAPGAGSQSGGAAAVAVSQAAVPAVRVCPVSQLKSSVCCFKWLCLTECAALINLNSTRCLCACHLDPILVCETIIQTMVLLQSPCLLL